ncbi:MAG: prepilin-type cleavage/methylation domain-containing protein [Desulfitobacterium hafniense]|nr:prepilin-type cleavage/methylation domain-containing protein [Desulfitobacterium hafniense]
MTLIEVLLALTILAGAGFLLMVKLPVYTGRQALDTSATQLLQELRDARQAALSENTWYQVKFYFTGGYYRIYRQGTKIKDITLPNGVILLNQPPDLIFNAAGAPNNGLTVLLGSGSIQRKVIVAPVTGRIREE